MCVYWQERWAGCLGTQSLVSVLPLSASVALTCCSDSMSIDFLSFMVGMLISVLPTSEVLGALKEIEWKVPYESTQNIIKML